MSESHLSLSLSLSLSDDSISLEALRRCPAGRDTLSASDMSTSQNILLRQRTTSRQGLRVQTQAQSAAGAKLNSTHYVYKVETQL